MEARRQDGWWRGLMLGLAVSLAAIAAKVAADEALDWAGWLMSSSFFLLPASLWMFAAWRFRRSAGGWRELCAAAAIVYLVFVANVAAFRTLSGKHTSDFNFPWSVIAITAIAFAWLPVAAPIAGRLAGLEAGESERHSRLARLLSPPVALVAGAGATVASLFLSMETGKGWEVLRAQRTWVTAEYGAAQWVSAPLDWIARVDYGVVLLLTVASLGLLVPSLRARLSPRTRTIAQRVTMLAALLLIVDLFCGWVVFLSEDMLFRHYHLSSGVVTLLGGLLWLGAAVSGLGDSVRVRRLRAPLLWVFLPLVACDLGSVLYLGDLEMYGTIALLFGLLLTSLGVAPLTSEASGKPVEHALPAVA